MAKFVVLLLLSCLPFCAPFAAEVIKRSETGLCHDNNSPWYERTRNFSAHASMQSCLAAGGKAYSGYATNSQATITDGYERDLFPHWLDEDDNCRDTRAETLIRQSEVPVAFADGAGCQVTSGRWHDPYTDSTFTNDALNVIAVSLSANRSKGAKGPAEWMPANQGFRCQYLQRFQVVTQKYQLAFTARESRVMSRQLSSCSRPG